MRKPSLFDVAIAALCLFLLAPLLVFIAVSIYLVDGTPVLVQEDWSDRLGRQTKLLAFRTHRVTVESLGNSFTGRTLLPRLGRFLRDSGSYMFPRLLNVLRCDCNTDVLYF
jgi:lipopolysaccharide/colanic/teichoic acid biosynthesis glycosyltransferase